MSENSGDGWSSPEGLKLLKDILKRLIPAWKDGPHDWQIKVTANILDGKDTYLVAACGEGKTAAAYLHLLVRQELARNPDLNRFGTKIVENPIAIMVGPLVDLGNSRVEEMMKIGLNAVALDAESIRKAKEAGVDLYEEQLTEAKFDRMLREKTFRSNIVAYIIDEAHVVIPWSLNFRKDYAEICRARHRIPIGTPMLAMTATSRIGIIYCKTIELCFRVASYLWRLLPVGTQRFRQVRTYHSLHWPATNAETLRSFCDDNGDTYIIVATIKFGMGVDVRRVHFVLNLGLPESIENDHQQRGRAMRDAQYDGVGITYVEKHIVTAIAKAVADGKAEDGGSRKLKKEARVGDDTQVTLEASMRANAGKDRKIDIALYGLIVRHIKKECLVAEVNRVFGNPDSLSHAVCKDARRRLPCSSCLQHPPYSQHPLGPAPLLPPAGAPSETHPQVIDLDSIADALDSVSTPTLFLNRSDAFIESPVVADAATMQKNIPKFWALTKDMKESASSELDQFARVQWVQKEGTRFQNLPSTLYFPWDLYQQLLSNIHNIRTFEQLAELMASWEFLNSDLPSLFNIVVKLNTRFDEEHRKKKAATKAKAAETCRKNKAANQARLLVDSEPQAVSGGVSCHGE
ncbi:P-loop containing nucleoside triphosphate hydrolase protein [Panus rudis PR-1116 ss-1]|nr:P-loop containing nucleoside triphosphate hydrolase protein [Panus rudis PR-1116 ss-1]